MRINLLMVGVLSVMLGQSAAATPPRMLLPAGRTSFAIMRLPEGRFAFYDRSNPGAAPLSFSDRNGRTESLLPSPSAELLQGKFLASGVLSNAQVILTRDNQVIGVYVKAERFDKETAAKVGLPLYLDVWVQRASQDSAAEPQMIWRGYNGSLMEYEQLPSGRILVPYGSFQPHAKAEPPTGRHKTIVQVSDDNGRTWRESESKLTSPCYAGFNGSNEGACEPSIERLADGRMWMLMRTQAGFLYESSSADDGATWQTAIPSRFNTSTGPPNIMRHENGWLVVCWNNCEMPPREMGQGVYGGRDALHIAVSDDNGKTWRGFREIYLDHRRNDNPAKSGDRGTAYPLGAFTEDGKIVVLAGQGEGGRNPIIVDPQWIVETEASTDFSDGLNQWSVYKHYGPAARWWRGRRVGCELVANPTVPDKQCLLVRKADEFAADGATWNFPNSWSGSLTARVMLRAGGHGGVICLNDRMFDPCNDYGEEFSVFRLDLHQSGNVGNAALAPDRWHDVQLKWNLARSECQLLVDGQPAGNVELRHRTLNGISYVRFRSTARDLDLAGFLVDRVSVNIDDPRAPPCTAEDQREQENRYVAKVVPLWRRK